MLKGSFLKYMQSLKGSVYLARVYVIQQHIQSPNIFCHLPCTKGHVNNLFTKSLIDFPSTENSLKVSLLSESPYILDGCTMWNA